jgi:hypothetical protein
MTSAHTIAVWCDDIERSIREYHRGNPYQGAQLDRLNKLKDMALRSLGDAREPVAEVVQREPYDDGTPNQHNDLNWRLDNCENSLPVGTKLFTAPPRSAAPEGYVLVLAEPTNDMADAGYRALSERGVDYHDCDDAAYAYKAMLRASGQSEQNEVKPPYVTCRYCHKNIPVFISGMATSALHQEDCEAYKQAERDGRA